MELSASFSWRNIGRWGLALIVFLLPFFFLPFTQYPVDAGKIVITSLLLAIGLISFFVCVVEEKSIVYPRSWLAIAVIAIVGIVGVSTWFSTSKFLSLYGKLFQPDSLLVFCAYGIAFFLFFYFFNEEDVPWLGGLFLGGLTIATIVNSLPVLGVFWSPWSFANTNAWNTLDTAFGWAILMAFALILIIATWLEGVHARRDKIFLVVCALIIIFGLFVVNFETIWIALALVIIAVGIYLASPKHFRTPFFLVVIAITIAIIAPRIPPIGSVPTEVKLGFLSSATIAFHAAHGWRSLVGSGPSTFGEQFTHFRSENLNQTNFWNFPFVQGYDFFLTFLTTSGILGVVAFFGLIGVFLWESFRKPLVKQGKVIAIGIITLLLVMPFYSASFVMMMYLFIMLGLFLSVLGSRREISFKDNKPPIIFTLFALIALLVACVVSGAYEIGVQYVAAAEYANGVSALNANNLSVATRDIQTSLSLAPSSDDAWRTASQISLLDGEQAFTAASGTLNTQAQSEFSSAIQAAQATLSVDSNNFLNWENMGSVYQDLIPVAGDAGTLARTAYQDAEAVDPQNPDLPIAIAQIDVEEANQFSSASDAGDAQKALADAEIQLNASLALKPGYASSLSLLAQIYFQQGDTAKAIQEISQAANANPFDPGIAFQLGVLLYQNNQLAAAQAQFERAVSLQSNYSNARYFLGLIYDNEGMTNAALSQFQAIAQLNPGNREIDQIIANIQNGKPALSGITTSGSSTPLSSSTASTAPVTKKK